MIAGEEDDDGPGSAGAAADGAASLVDDDNGSFDVSDVTVAGFDESAGLVFLPHCPYPMCSSSQEGPRL